MISERGGQAFKTGLPMHRSKCPLVPRRTSVIDVDTGCGLVESSSGSCHIIGSAPQRQTNTQGRGPESLKGAPLFTRATENQNVAAASHQPAGWEALKVSPVHQWHQHSFMFAAQRSCTPQNHEREGASFAEMARNFVELATETGCGLVFMERGQSTREVSKSKKYV
eukprot:m.374198 g.374198  ORF g.374198 m.374198 type:complete len:167 (+) comp16691_c3_seq29:2413-2913(+)